MSKKVSVLLSLTVLLTLVLNACGGAAPVATQPPATAAPTATSAPTEAPATAAPTTAPTTAPEETFAPEVKAVITITLPKGATWSDGTPLTSKDVVGTWNILWMRKSTSWNSLFDVVAKDDQTVQWQISTPGPAILDAIVRSNSPRPYSQYGKWMDAAAKFRADNADLDGDEVKAANDELNAFLPDAGVVYGPYNIDPASVTEAQFTMKKVPTGFNADKIDFDSVIVYYGDTEQDLPLYLSGDMDYSSNAYSPANLDAIRAANPNIVVLGGPATNGPGIYFNNDVYPLGKKEVRQAIAYAIDRVENCTVAFGESCRPVKYMVGFTDAAVPTWLSTDQIAKLNTYDYNPDKAAELLTGLGFKKGSDGIWVDDQGKKMEFELKVPADFTEYLASSENVAQQLAKFGIKINVKPYDSAQRNDMHKAGDYQMSMDIGMRFTYFHPFVSYDYNLRPGIGFKNDPEAAEGSRGMDFPYLEKTADGKEINIKDEVDKMAEGFDIEAQKPHVADVASMFNENLPVVQMFERYLTDPVDTQTRVTGWLPVDDPIYKNNQNNSPVARQFLSGTLKPSDTNTAKEFKTSYPYVQPPKGNYNLYSPDTILINGAVLSTFLYPPLTFYDVNEGKYIPFFAESWDIKIIQ
ncbi:MAG TPA: ABC transporter substrate-binding protein [Anaerolineales bacterium]|nr:ABC transporter substrate-binding protein [Anaerolineales bacterium]